MVSQFQRVLSKRLQGCVSITAAGVGTDHIEDLPGTVVMIRRCCYGVEDYAWWSEQLGRDIAPGTFGENLTIAGFNGHEWSVGDHVIIGDGPAAVEMIILPPRPML